MQGNAEDMNGGDVVSEPLPKLPVPPLMPTLEKYLNILKPVVSEEQYRRTSQIVEEFGKSGGEGERLQEKLLEYAETQTNWVYKWWLEDMYSNCRLPLPINSNPGMVFPKQKFNDQDGQLRFAARLISGILDYKVVIDKRALPIDKARSRKPGQPLCMEQYYRLFSTYRLPGVKKDILVTQETSLLPEPEHVIVACNNQFFVLDVIVNFKRLSEENLLTQLKRIVSIATQDDDQQPAVGLMTTEGRTEWALARQRLMQDSMNRDSLDMIERCIFLLCLDKSLGFPMTDIKKPIDQDDVHLAYQMLHGGGSKYNAANRWYDKTMQFIVSDDGAAGLVYEHSPSEGVAVIQLIEHLLKYLDSETRKRKLLRAQSICELPFPRKLRWKQTAWLTKDLETARVKLDRLADDLDLQIMRFTEYGKNFPKSQNMSPDAYIQLALQLAYYKVHGHLTHTYESASTRRFQLGRVDNIRAASIQALEFAEAMTGIRAASALEKKTLMRAAMDYQTEYMIQTILGHGVDCHLLGLRQLARELNWPTPAIFEDQCYKESNLFPLSTSQVLTKMDCFMYYGPVVPNGYGAAYNPHENYILFAISSLKSSAETNSLVFRHSLHTSLLEMQELLLGITDSACLNGHSETNGRENGASGEAL
ncbi:choline O-acetyltransferase-like isoform X2 [Ptychodera flava]|uniref:choline O-acetyltransferase-like isoform X2 n=1 Tax=Ptychodera flava TaxID=63121 RepID=UPI00396A8BB1